MNLPIASEWDMGSQRLEAFWSKSKKGLRGGSHGTHIGGWSQVAESVVPSLALRSRRALVNCPQEISEANWTEVWLPQFPLSTQVVSKVSG